LQLRILSLLFSIDEKRSNPDSYWDKAANKKALRPSSRLSAAE
jgi:hypothetical protein